MKEREFFSSRWGLILAAIGMAVGTGNIWRFPRIAAQNGGGSFLIPWLIFLLLWSIPLIMCEFALGKSSRFGTIGAFAKTVGKKFAWMGGFVGFCTMAIMFYYSVVSGWCIKYFVSSVTGELAGLDPAGSKLAFGSFIESYEPILYHLLAMIFCCFVIHKGVVRGIERLNRVLIPGLFVFLVIAAVRALTLPGAMEGLNYFFTPDLETLLDHKTWLEALSQSAWSTGAGWGLILTYAVYMRKNEDIGLNACITGFANNSVSIIAGITIFCAVFALSPVNPSEVLQSSGKASTGLTFEWMPALFNVMPGGPVFQALFFLTLAFAALSSLISMIELATRLFMDVGLPRKRSILFVGSLSFLFGLPSAINLGFFENQDWVWGLGLIVSGVFVAFAAIKYGVDQFRSKLVNTEGNDLYVGKWFNVVVTILIPIEFAALMIWWFYNSSTSFSKEWWNPLDTFSVGTCLMQWGLLILVLVIFNRWIVRKTLGDVDQEPA